MQQGRERGRRQDLRRGAAALLGGLGLLLASCGDDGVSSASEERLAGYQEHGIVLGVSPEPPYGYEAGGDVTGGEPELAREIFSRLGIEVRDYVMTDFGFVLDGLEADRLDVISAAMFITPERAEKVLFANPAFCSTTAFVVPAGNPDGIEDYDSVLAADITLGLVSGTFQQDEARRSGVVDVEEFPINEEALAALDEGEVDAVALTTFTANLAEEERDGYEATEGFLPVIDGEEQLGCGAFGFRYEDQALRDAFNDELAAMQEAGEVLPLVEPFGYDAVAVDTAVDLTADELAGGVYDE